MNDDRIRMYQCEKIGKLKIQTIQTGFTIQRPLAQYIGIKFPPDLFTNLQLTSLGLKPTTTDEYNIMSNTLKRLKETRTKGLDFLKAVIKTSRLVFLGKASFSNAKDLKSRLVFLFLIMYEEERENVGHYGSHRCKWAKIIFMASQIYALVLWFYYASILQEIFYTMVGQTILIDAFVDSKTVCDVISTYVLTTERCLHIYICYLR